MCTICIRVQKCTRDANLLSGCIFGHVSGFKKIHPEENLLPGANCAHVRLILSYVCIHFDKMTDRAVYHTAHQHWELLGQFRESDLGCNMLDFIMTY